MSSFSSDEFQAQPQVEPIAATEPDPTPDAMESIDTTAAASAPTPPGPTGLDGGVGAASSRGPLSKLVNRLSDTPLAHQAQHHLPDAARPLLARTAEPAGRVVRVVDDTLSTEEAHKLALSARDFFHALAGFTLMVLAAAVTKLEATLDIAPPAPAPVPDVPADASQESAARDGGSAGGDAHRARALVSRYASVIRVAFQKASHNMNGRGAAAAPTAPETDIGMEGGAPRRREEILKSKAKCAARFASQMSAYSLSCASQWTGAGSKTIAPAANYVISNLPEGAKQAVHASRSPFDGTSPYGSGVDGSSHREGQNDVMVD